ncbi:MAG TPA: class I SAM-dependent methyltransferase [Candidatus Bathyarchaeia archaeon]|nr:class I SAM-dependent methyltransferase [Candidatus Bathyarchaeia archaeon]
MNRRTLLHRDDGLAATRTRSRSLADLELEVIGRFLSTEGRVLDIGCGRGRGSVYFALQGLDPVGIEIDLPTLAVARQLSHENNASRDFLCADGRSLCFRDQSLDYVVLLGSVLSEKHRFWMVKADRLAVIAEALRVTKAGGTVVNCFVHRYWNLKSFLAFLRNYWVWFAEKVDGKRTELGDYVENIGGTPVRFHAFTVREARSLYPKENVRLTVWKGNHGPFTDWFFILARKA